MNTCDIILSGGLCKNCLDSEVPNREAIPKVSVVTPVYNAEKYLRACLDSVLSQTLKDIEIICVDDCSTDGSPAILAEYGKKDSRIKAVFLPENHGTFYARRTGMLASHGKYVMFLDNDDLYRPNACERAYKLIEESHCDMVHFSTILFQGDKISAEPNYLSPRFKRIEERNLLKACFVQGLFTHTLWDKIYKGEIIRKAAARMTKERIPGLEDYVQFFMIATLMKTAFASPEDHLYCYRVGIGAMSNVNFTMHTVRSCPFAEEWLKQMPDATEEDYQVLEVVRQTTKGLVLDKLLSAQQLDEKTLLKVGESCGTEMLVKFIMATGLLNLPFCPRHNICGQLFSAFQQQQKELERLKNPHPTYTLKNQL